jgi:hypothetical protein
MISNSQQMFIFWNGGNRLFFRDMTIATGGSDDIYLHMSFERTMRWKKKEALASLHLHGTELTDLPRGNVALVGVKHNCFSCSFPFVWSAHRNHQSLAAEVWGVWARLSPPAISLLLSVSWEYLPPWNPAGGNGFQWQDVSSERSRVTIWFADSYRRKEEPHQLVGS